MQEIIKSLQYGFKRLLYSKNSQDIFILSIPKVFFLLIYILCLLLSFIQFSTVEVSDIVVLEPLTTLEQRKYAISPNIFGFLAQILSIFLVLGIFFFIFSGDKPLDEQLKHLKKKIQERNIITIFFLFFFSGILLLALLAIFGKITIGSTETLLGVYSYRTSILVLYIWLLIQPALVLSGSFLLLNLITLEKADSLQGGRKSIIFFWSMITFTIFLMLSVYLIFDVTLDLRPDPLDVKPLDVVIESIGFFRINLYWLIVNLNILLIIIFLLSFMLYLTEKLRLIESTPFSRNQILFFLCVIIVMPIIVIFFSLPSAIAFSQVVIPLDYIIFAFYIFCLLFIFFLNRRYFSLHYLKTRRTLISWLLFFSVIFLLFKTIPTAVFFTTPTLKTLWNMLDLLGLAAVMFVGILRVLIVSEVKVTSFNNTQNSRFLNWSNRIPPYSKALFLLYLSFISFYTSSESYAIAVLFQIPDFMANLKLEFLTASFFVGAFYAFWVYRPVPKNSPFFEFVRKKLNTKIKRSKLV